MSIASTRQAEEKADTPAQGGSSGRRVGFRVIVVLLCLALALTGGRLLLYGWFDSGSGGLRKFDDIAWGVVEGVIVLGALLTQLRAPQRHTTGPRQALLGLVALFAGGAATGALDPATLLVIALVIVTVALHPARRHVLRRPGRPDRLLLSLALAGSVPLVVWFVNIVQHGNAVAPNDVHATHDDFAGLAGLALALALTAVLASFDTRSMLPVICSSAGSVLIGLASLVLSDQADALSTPAAIAAVAGGTVFGAVGLRRRHPEEHI